MSALVGSRATRLASLLLHSSFKHKFANIQNGSKVSRIA